MTICLHRDKLHLAVCGKRSNCLYVVDSIEDAMEYVKSAVYLKRKNNIPLSVKCKYLDDYSYFNIKPSKDVSEILAAIEENLLEHYSDSLA